MCARSFKASDVQLENTDEVVRRVGDAGVEELPAAA
jgi:hypothetical protein